VNPVYLIDGCRSPIGRGHASKGMYRTLRADDLAVQTLKALLKRTPVDPESIDDFFVGCVGQHLEQGKNIARLILLLAGLPNTIPGVTINRLCASSLTALQMAADSIRAGSNRLMLVGGLEHLGHVPMTAALNYNPALFDGADFQWTNMGLTAEKLAEMYGISRREQDAFAMESNRRYFAAVQNGRFGREVVNIKLDDGTIIESDEEPRMSTEESLAALRTPFKGDGTVTAGNSSGVSDGACMAIVGDEASVQRTGVRPLARIRECVTVGLDPALMGLGPIYAIPKLLEKVGLKLQQIDLVEINEAFAVQVLACQRELGIPSDRLNVSGGAVALGHPLGMSGLRIALSTAYDLAARSGRYGIASMCVGHGQGVAMLLEGMNS
jgi:acetyl-CoA acyltransferase